MLHLYTGSTEPNRASDPFRLHEAATALRRALDPEGVQGANTSVLAPRGLTPDLLLQHLATIPFLAPARLVVVEGLVAHAGGGRTAVETWQPLLDALPTLPPTNHLLLLEPGDSREERMALGRSALYAALTALPDADVRHFAELRLRARRGNGRWVNEIAEWTAERAAADGIALGPGVADLLADLLGGDLWAIAMELQKLATYAAARQITTADVELLTAQAREAEIFALLDAVAEGRGADALRLVRRRVAHGSDHPGRVRAAIAGQLRNVVRTAEILDRGGSEDDVAQATGIRHPLPLRKVQQQARAIGAAHAEAALRALAHSDYSVKTGRLPETLALELLVVDLGRITAQGMQRARGGRSGGGGRRPTGVR